MKNRGSRLFVLTYIAFTFALFASLIVAKVSYKKTSEAKLISARSSNVVEINWEELYPYDTLVDELSSGVEKKERSKPDKFKNRLLKLSKVGNEWAGFTFFYDDISKLGYAATAFLKDPSVGTIYVKNRNGYVTYARSKKLSLDEAREDVVVYASLQEYLTDKGIDFLYFSAPSKVCRFDDQLSDGVICYDNDNIDTYLEAMKLYGIQYVDLRDNIHADDMDHYAMYFKTDHHWTAETGLWVASQMAKELNERYGYSLTDAKKLGEYETLSFPKAEFGAQGETVTHVLVKPEDFTIPFPKFDTDYRLVIPNKGVDERGSFEELFVDQDGIKDIANQGGGAAYGKVLYGNPPYVAITNYNNPNGPKVFMIRDSYASVVAPYFAASCSELVLIDTRIENGNFTGSIINCINQFNPDIVITCQCDPQKIRLNK